MAPASAPLYHTSSLCLVWARLRLYRQRHKGNLELVVYLCRGDQSEAKAWLLQHDVEDRLHHLVASLPEDLREEDITDDFRAACTGGASYLDHDTHP